MASKLNRIAGLVGEAVGNIETATAGAGSKAQRRFGDAASAIVSSSAADRIDKRTKPIRKVIADKATSAKKVAKKKAAPAKRKATSAKKVAKKKAAPAKAQGHQRQEGRQEEGGTGEAQGHQRQEGRQEEGGTGEAQGHQRQEGRQEEGGTGEAQGHQRQEGRQEEGGLTLNASSKLCSVLSMEEERFGQPILSDEVQDVVEHLEAINCLGTD